MSGSEQWGVANISSFDTPQTPPLSFGGLFHFILLSHYLIISLSHYLIISLSHYLIISLFELFVSFDYLYHLIICII
jgi:hypothetical protein